MRVYDPAEGLTIQRVVYVSTPQLAPGQPLPEPFVVTDVPSEPAGGWKGRKRTAGAAAEPREGPAWVARALEHPDRPQ